MRFAVLIGSSNAQVRKMGLVHHEYIVHYHTSAISFGKFYIVMELIVGVEWKDMVLARHATGDAFSFEQIAEWAKQLTSGLAFLHDECHLIHQDLHNGNVMITGLSQGGAVDDDTLKKTRVKILDLGLSSFKSDQARGGTSLRTMRMGAMRTTTIRASMRSSNI